MPIPDDFSALQAQLETMESPQAVLRWAAQTYGDRLAVVTSFQPTGIVTLHMLQQIAPRTPVLTLDTGRLFPQTYALIDRLERDLNLNLRRVRAEMSLDEQNQHFGVDLWRRDPDLCCYLRKVQPLEQALAHGGFGAWITGLRRDQSPERANTPIITWDGRHDMPKIAPFATWTEAMIWTYIKTHELPYNPLHDQGYPSIGCVTCTRAVADGEDARAGRWSFAPKTECGLHLHAKK